MRVDQCGRPIVSVDEGIDALLNGHNITNCVFTDAKEVNLYNENTNLFKNERHLSVANDETDVSEYYNKAVNTWHIPEEYKEIDVEQYILYKCKTDEQKSRVCMEMEEFSKRGLIDVLRCLIFLVDYMRDNKIVWGVGRGSSVSSYCLYLIGIHRVDSLKYDLDIKEFLK